MAASLRVRLGLDSKGFSQGISKAKKSIKKMKGDVTSGFKGMFSNLNAMAAVNYIGAQITQTMEWGTKIRDLAQQFGVTTGFVQKMDYAFKQTGMDGEKGMLAIREMMLKTAEATTALAAGEGGTNAIVKSFAQLGITVDQIKSLKPEQLFMEIAKNLKDADMASSDLHFSLNQIFGGEGSNLLITFASDLEGMFARLEELDAVVSDESIQRIGAVGDKLEEFKTQHQGVWADIVGGALQLFGGFVNFVKSGVEVVASRMYTAWEGITALARAAGHVWDAITNLDASALKKAAAEMNEVKKSLSGTLGSPLAFLEDVGTEMNKGDVESARKHAAKKEIQRIEEEKKQMMEMAKKRLEGIEKIKQLEEIMDKRRFAALTPEQQLLELQKERIKQQEKLNKLTEPMGDPTKDKRLKGLEGKDKQAMLGQISSEKLAYLTQQEAVAKSIADEEAVKGKGGGKIQMAGGISDAYTALSSIGGQIGAKNPLVTMQAKALKVAESQDNYLHQINSTMTTTFKG